MRFLLCGLLFVVVGMCSLAAEQTPAWDLPLTSVLVREKDIFAANMDGLYRATTAERQWQRLPIPVSMPPNGKFAQLPPGIKTIYYFASHYASWQMPDAEKKVFGLYASQDDGQHWQLVSKEYDFKDVFLHTNGTLYAVVEIRKTITKTAEPGTGTATGESTVTRSDNILLSKDGGHTWRNITDGPGYPTIVRIFPDPDHPQLVCLVVNTIRNYVLQAEDEQYHWKSTREWDWFGTRMTDEHFLYPYISTQNTLYMFTATLNNYFQYDFGSRTSISGLTIVPEQTAYTFASAGPKLIRVSAVFLPDAPSVTLVDQERNESFWGIKVIYQNGARRQISAAAAQEYYQSKDRDGTRQAIRAREGFGQHTISNGHPYTRMLDLAELYPFPEKGAYRVQLLYDNAGIADVKQEWSGYFAGAVFTVTIE